MKKLFSLIVMAVVAVAVNAQTKSIDGITFLQPKDSAIIELNAKFGSQPATRTDEKITYKKVAFDGENYDEAVFFFDSYGKLSQMRFRNMYKTHAQAVKRLNVLEKKYAATYKSSWDNDPEGGGKFVVGYDTNGARLYTISTFRGRCELGFGPF